MIVDLLCDSRLWAALAVILGAYILRPTRSPFPFVNNYPNDFLGHRARDALRQDAGKIIANGLAKHGGPISIKIPYGVKTILPASLASWSKSNKDLDHRELVRQDFMAGYPGFEAQTVLHSEDEALKSIIRTKMGTNPSIIPVMNTAIAKGLDVIWGDDPKWHTIDWYKDTMGIIARGASSVFVGPEKCEDEEWLDLVQNYTMAYFSAVGDLQSYPPWLRHLIQWFLPNPSACRKLVRRARVIMNHVSAQRKQEVTAAENSGLRAPQYNDALSWTESAGVKAEPGDVQLSLAMAGLFTTSEAFRQTIIEIARSPDIVEDLRKEVTEQIGVNGTTMSALANMGLLDSVMKEAQRLASAKVALERIALKDTTLPSGQIVPRGTHLMVDSTNLWDPAVYPNPHAFDGYRFLKRRDAGDTSSQFVQSSADYHVFGGGRHICPGRFFANTLLKLALSHILLKYDLRLHDGSGTEPLSMGFYTIVNPMVQLQVKRRAQTGGELL